MKNIYNEILELNRGKGAGVLVTVVRKTGSGPAAAGTKMLVYPDESIVGTVGGGTIEKMALEKALKIFKTHENCLEAAGRRRSFLNISHRRTTSTFLAPDMWARRWCTI